MDFMHDQLATGRKLRVLTTVDTFSRFSPAIKPRFTAALTLWGYSKKPAGKSDRGSIKAQNGTVDTCRRCSCPAVS
jgi:hypothetical protein